MRYALLKLILHLYAFISDAYLVYGQKNNGRVNNLNPIVKLRIMEDSKNELQKESFFLEIAIK